MSSRLFAPLNEATTIAHVYGFLIFGRVVIVSIIILSSIFIVVLPLLLPNQSAFATFPGENGKIAFTSTRDVSEEIYVMNSDGTNPTRLTNNTSIHEFPSWSPDGTKIAFTRNIDIYVMNAHDGSNQTNISNNAAFDSLPSWSPDGTKIAFTSTRDGNSDIYVMNAHDGSNQTRLTNNTDIDESPDWSTAATEPE